MNKKVIILFLFLLMFVDIILPNKSYTIPIPDRAEYAKRVHSYFLETDYHQVAHIITAITVQESAWFQNKGHYVRNNFFSVKDFKDPKCCTQLSMKNQQQTCNHLSCLKRFAKLEDNLLYMKRYFKRKGYRTTPNHFYEDLIKYHYAEDKNYIQNLKRVIKSLRKRNLI